MLEFGPKDTQLFGTWIPLEVMPVVCVEGGEDRISVEIIRNAYLHLRREQTKVMWYKTEKN